MLVTNNLKAQVAADHFGSGPLASRGLLQPVMVPTPTQQVTAVRRKGPSKSPRGKGWCNPAGVARWLTMTEPSITLPADDHSHSQFSWDSFEGNMQASCEHVTL